MSVGREEGFRRLGVLQDKLLTVPDEHFSIDQWVECHELGIPHSELRFDLPGYAEPWCGTAACAIGWATVTPELVDLGLRITRPPFEEFTVHYGKATNMNAVMGFFDISRLEADFMFGSSPYYAYECAKESKCYLYPFYLDPSRPSEKSYDFTGLHSTREDTITRMRYILSHGKDQKA
jgi:hypothetical protein